MCIASCTPLIQDILKNGEFEDYIEPKSLIEILKIFTPEIELTPEYIIQNRSRGLATSKIIAKYYNEQSLRNQNPSKPDVAKLIAKYWVANEIPEEFLKIMNTVLDLAPEKELKI